MQGSPEGQSWGPEGWSIGFLGQIASLIHFEFSVGAPRRQNYTSSRLHAPSVFAELAPHTAIGDRLDTFSKRANPRWRQCLAALQTEESHRWNTAERVRHGGHVAVTSVAFKR